MDGIENETKRKKEKEGVEFWEKQGRDEEGRERGYR